MPSASEGGPDTSIRRPLASLIVARFGSNVLIRFPYTFATMISRAFGIPLDTLTALLGLRELGGLAAPAIGRVADRGHERSTMVTVATVAGVTTLTIALAPPLWLMAALLVAGGVAKFGLDTAQSAWIAHRVPFARRSRVFGVVETAWAFALLVGIPICGVVADLWGWRAMFVFTGAVLVCSAAVMHLVVTQDRPAATRRPPRPRVTSAMAGMWVYSALQPLAQMFVFAVYGDWFVRSLHMSDARLSAMSMLIGLGEVVGTGLTAVVTDRIGKRRAAIVGMLLAAPVSGCLGLAGGHQGIGVVLVVFAAVGFEFSFVSALPLIAELDPRARASAIGAAIALGTVARAASATLSGVTYVRVGMGAVGIVAAAICLAAAVALWTVSEPHTSKG